MNKNIMKADKLKIRLQEDRPMSIVSIRMPEDIIADLERLEEQTAVSNLIQSLRKHGVEESVLETAVAESRVKYKV